MMLKIFTLAAVVAVASAQFTSGGTMTINGVVQKPDADGVTRLGVTKDAEEGSGDGTAVVDVKAQLEAGITAAKAAMKAAKCDGARARREVDCKGAGAIECSKCACLQPGDPTAPCSTEDSTWCYANLAGVGKNCMQYSGCAQDGVDPCVALKEGLAAAEKALADHAPSSTAATTASFAVAAGAAAAMFF